LPLDCEIVEPDLAADLLVEGDPCVKGKRQRLGAAVLFGDVEGK
jgi:hypothetical protein